MASFVRVGEQIPVSPAPAANITTSRLPRATPRPGMTIMITHKASLRLPPMESIRVRFRKIPMDRSLLT